MSYKTTLMIIRTSLACKSLRFSLIEGERITNYAEHFCSFPLMQSFFRAVKYWENLNLLPRLLLVLLAFPDVSLFSLTFCAHFLSKIYLPILFHLLFPLANIFHVFLWIHCWRINFLSQLTSLYLVACLSKTQYYSIQCFPSEVCKEACLSVGRMQALLDEGVA
jgi:hypothetical protein